MGGIPIARLKQEAKESTERRGHRVGYFKTTGANTATATCACGMAVHVDEHPPPNGIDIAGEAVALQCPNPRLTL